MKIDPAHISLDFPRTASIAVDVDGPCRVAARNIWESMARFCLYLCADTLRYLRSSMSARVARAVLISSDS